MTPQSSTRGHRLAKAKVACAGQVACERRLRVKGRRVCLRRRFHVHLRRYHPGLAAARAGGCSRCHGGSLSPNGWVSDGLPSHQRQAKVTERTTTAVAYEQWMAAGLQCGVQSRRQCPYFARWFVRRVLHVRMVFAVDPQHRHQRSCLPAEVQGRKTHPCHLQKPIALRSKSSALRSLLRILYPRQNCLGDPKRSVLLQLTLLTLLSEGFWSYGHRNDWLAL